MKDFQVDLHLTFKVKAEDFQRAQEDVSLVANYAAEWGMENIEGAQFVSMSTNVFDLEHNPEPIPHGD